MSVKIFIIGILCCIIFGSCTKKGTGPSEKTAAQLVAEGWTSYLAHDYSLATSLFSEAISKDIDLVDAYNGLGWTNAKLNNLTEAVNNYLTGLEKDSNNLEIKAGLAFVYNAQKSYAQSITQVNQILNSDAGWAFNRDTSISISDLRVLQAQNYFAQANYSLSLQQVQLLNPLFSANISTVSGQAALAQEIERLRPLV